MVAKKSKPAADAEKEDDEFKQFILDNKERILKILESEIKDDKDAAPKESKKTEQNGMKNDGFNYYTQILNFGIADGISKKIHEQVPKGKFEDATKGMTSAFLDPEVQKHFVTMGVELMQGLETLMKAIPKSGFAQEVYEKAESTKDIVADVKCDRNSACKKKKAPVAKKIELE